jgi:hypothetical protein
MIVALGVWALAPTGVPQPSFEWRQIVPVAVS